MAKAKVGKGEFLILEVGDTRGVGASFVLRGQAETLAKAKAELDKLAVGTAARLAIVETMGVYVREPVVTVKSVGDTILPRTAVMTRAGSLPT
jgi:hypothetical protein